MLEFSILQGLPLGHLSIIIPKVSTIRIRNFQILNMTRAVLCQTSILPGLIHSFIISLLFSSGTTQKLPDYCLETPSLFKKMGSVLIISINKFPTIPNWKNHQGLNRYLAFCSTSNDRKNL